MRPLQTRREVGAAMYPPTINPAHHEERRIGKTLRAIRAYLQRQPHSAVEKLFVALRDPVTLRLAEFAP